MQRGGCPLEDLTIAQLQTFSTQIEADVYQHLSIESTLDKREVLGGTSRSQVEKAMANIQSGNEEY